MNVESVSDVLHRISLVLADGQPALIELAGGDLLAAATRIAGEIQEVGSCRRDNCVVCTSAAGWWPLTVVYDLALVQCGDLALIAIEREAQGSRVFWHRFSANPTPEFVLQSISISLFNALKAVRRLVCEGLDGPARVLLRHSIELSDVMVAVTGRKESFVKYRAARGSPDDTYRHWRQGLAPGTIRREVEAIERGIQVPEHIVQDLKAVRDGAYRWLSGFAHVSLAGQAFSAYSPLDAEPDRITPAMEDGVVRHSSRSTLLHGVIQSCLALNTTRYLLAHQHKWHGLRGDSVRCFFMYRAELMMNLFVATYPQLKSLPNDQSGRL